MSSEIDRHYQAATAAKRSADGPPGERELRLPPTPEEWAAAQARIAALEAEEIRATLLLAAREAFCAQAEAHAAHLTDLLLAAAPEALVRDVMARDAAGVLSRATDYLLRNGWERIEYPSPKLHVYSKPGSDDVREGCLATCLPATAPEGKAQYTDGPSIIVNAINLVADYAAVEAVKKGGGLTGTRADALRFILGIPEPTKGTESR